MVLLVPQVLMDLLGLIPPVLVILEGRLIHARVHSEEEAREVKALLFIVRLMEAPRDKVEEVVEVGDKNLAPLQILRHINVVPLARNLILALQPRTAKTQQPRT